MVIKETLNQLIGKKIASLRDLNRLSQTDLAKQISVNRATISNIEAGRQNISVHLLYKIAEVFETDVAIIIPTFKQLEGHMLRGKEQIEKLLDEQNASDSLKNVIRNVGKSSKDDK